LVINRLLPRAGLKEWVWFSRTVEQQGRRPAHRRTSPRKPSPRTATRWPQLSAGLRTCGRGSFDPPTRSRFPAA